MREAASTIAAKQQEEPKMDNLIARVAAAAGTTPETARQAVALRGEGMGATLKGLMGTGSGAMGGGGLMALGGDLMNLGLGMDQIQTVGKEVFAYARDAAGDDVVGEISAAIPGLSQFI
jgi:hypothetical protein